MIPGAQDHAKASLEFLEFMSEYNKYLKYYTEAQRLIVIIKVFKKRNTQISLLYEQAVEAHIAAVNAYYELVSIYTEFAQKLLEQCPRAGI